MTTKARMPASIMAFSAWVPRVGGIELKLETCRAKGRAPAWIWLASWVASSLVKSPVMEHSPLVMASLTVG